MLSFLPLLLFELELETELSGEKAGERAGSFGPVEEVPLVEGG